MSPFLLVHRRILALHIWQVSKRETWDSQKISWSKRCNCTQWLIVISNQSSLLRDARKLNSHRLQFHKQMMTCWVILIISICLAGLSGQLKTFITCTMLWRSTDSILMGKRLIYVIHQWFGQQNLNLVDTINKAVGNHQLSILNQVKGKYLPLSRKLEHIKLM